MFRLFGAKQAPVPMVLYCSLNDYIAFLKSTMDRNNIVFAT